MAVIAGITVNELRESFSEGIAEGGPRATKAYYVPNWSDRYTVANGLLGLSHLSGGPGGQISFTHPYPYPESYNMWAREVTVRGIGKCTQGPRQIQWDSAALIVNYGIPQFSLDQASDQGGYNSFDPTAPLIYASQSLDFGAQVIDLKPGSCQYVKGGVTKPLQQGYGLFVGVITMTLVLHKLPYLVPISVRSRTGQINSVPFFGCAAGTLRFDGAHTQREYNNDGSIVQDTQLKFAYRPAAAWDYILDPEGTSLTWCQVQRAGASVLLSFDHAQLLPSAYLGTG